MKSVGVDFNQVIQVMILLDFFARYIKPLLSLYQSDRALSLSIVVMSIFYPFFLEYYYA